MAWTTPQCTNSELCATQSVTRKLAQMIAGEVGDWRQQEQSHLTYASDAPVLNTARSTRPLPCYVTNAEDYDRPVPEVLEDPAR